MSIPHEKVKSTLKRVYRDGLRETKRILSEEAKNGDVSSRQLLSAIGLCEQGVDPKPVDLEERDNETVRPATVAGQIRSVLRARRKALVTERLVEAMVGHGLSPDDAIKNLLNDGEH